MQLPADLRNSKQQASHNLRSRQSVPEARLLVHQPMDFLPFFEVLMACLLSKLFFSALVRSGAKDFLAPPFFFLAMLDVAVMVFAMFSSNSSPDSSEDASDESSSLPLLPHPPARPRHRPFSVLLHLRPRQLLHLCLLLALLRTPL